MQWVDDTCNDYRNAIYQQVQDTPAAAVGMKNCLNPSTESWLTSGTSSKLLFRIFEFG